jgi:hypothetical protein
MHNPHKLTRRHALQGLGASIIAAEGALKSDPSAQIGSGRIDRQALVRRNNVVLTSPDLNSPLQVGNGEFAFGVDITGLQTFAPFNTMSQWGWHRFELPAGQKPDDFRGAEWDTHGRKVRYPSPSAEQPELGQWLYDNPQRLNLGRIAMRLTKLNGADATVSNLMETRQELDLWSGIITSRFLFEGEPVLVETCCHPKLDMIAVRIRSKLIASGRLSIRLEFPGPDHAEFANFVGDWNRPELHQTTVKIQVKRRADFARSVDGANYCVSLAWYDEAHVSEPSDAHPHRIELAATSGDSLDFVCGFSVDPLPELLPSVAQTFNATVVSWKRFWMSGGAIDLSQSKDPRWKELERRIVLSQYLMAVNEAGSLPPQESGLVNNGWHGKFHMEMYWWHGAHYALWNRWQLLQRSLGIYNRFHPSARERAHGQGFKGARWPKMTSADGWESTHPINALLVWQQPHPMFFAELDYRAHPTRATLEKWREILFDTADFLSSYAFYDDTTSRCVLGPPMYIVSENTEPHSTSNPTYELSQWRFGLRIANQWRKRLRLPPNPVWEKVPMELAPLPQQNGLYVTHEGIQDMWTKMTFEHPALTGVYGMLPGDGVDVKTMQRTFQKVMQTWNFNRTWGWDFPMLAMCAAKLGDAKTAVDLLLHPSGGFQFDARGLATGGPFPYFPANGGLLYAVALMAAGWDGAPEKHAPGFPDDGSWTVRWEGLSKAL